MRRRGHDRLDRVQARSGKRFVAGAAARTYLTSRARTSELASIIGADSNEAEIRVAVDFTKPGGTVYRGQEHRYFAAAPFFARDRRR